MRPAKGEIQKKRPKILESESIRRVTCCCVSEHAPMADSETFLRATSANVASPPPSSSLPPPSADYSGTGGLSPRHVLFSPPTAGATLLADPLSRRDAPASPEINSAVKSKDVSGATYPPPLPSLLLEVAAAEKAKHPHARDTIEDAEPAASDETGIDFFRGAGEDDGPLLSASARLAASSALREQLDL